MAACFVTIGKDTNTKQKTVIFIVNEVYYIAVYLYQQWYVKQR